MRFISVTLCILLCIASSPAAAREQEAPKEENCSLAIEAGLEQLRHIPPDLKQRDDEDRRKLLADMEQLVETNRRAGVSECRTWTQMMGKAFNQ